MLAFSQTAPTTRADIWCCRSTAAPARTLVSSAFDDTAASFLAGLEDGRRFKSADSGRWEIYVAAPARRTTGVVVSTDGGERPLWTRTASTSSRADS